MSDQIKRTQVALDLTLDEAEYAGLVKAADQDIRSVADEARYCIRLLLIKNEYLRPGYPLGQAD